MFRSFQTSIIRGTGFAPTNASRTRGAARLFGLVALWVERRRSRIGLSELPPNLLKDIGLNPEDVARECAKPFWR